MGLESTNQSSLLMVSETSLSGFRLEHAYKRHTLVGPRDALRQQLLSLTTKAKNLTQNSGPLFPGASWFSFGGFGDSPHDFRRVLSEPIKGDFSGKETSTDRPSFRWP